MYFVYNWDLLTIFCSSDSSFNGNTSLYFKYEISAHAQLCDYSFIDTINNFHDIVLAVNLH